MRTRLAKKLKELFEVRNRLAACESLDTVVDEALDIARSKLRSQTASVFLFSKAGLLERVGINGVDKDGLSIPEDWFSGEQHAAGNSFTGKVILPRDGATFGEPIWSNDLDTADLDPRCKAAYLEKLGSLVCALAVPLNGQHRTYGVLEVVNKLAKQGGVDSTRCFSQDDAYWLSTIGISLAAAISSLRRENKRTMLADISRLLMEPYSSRFDPQSVYSEIVHRIVGPMLSYKACILRVEQPTGKIETVARAGDEITWDLLRDGPILSGSGLAGEVWATGKRVIFKDIEPHRSKFKNQAWIEANQLKSYVCLPLSVGDKISGTLSLFIGYRHIFDSDELNFLDNIASLLAAFTESSRVMDELRAVQQELDRERDKILGSAREVAYDLQFSGLLHDQKHFLLGLQRELELARGSSPNRSQRIVSKQITEIKKKVDRVEGDLESTSEERLQGEPVDINRVIRDVVRYFQLELKGIEGEIAIIPSYSNDIPLIFGKESEIREVVFNLVSNAVKAIRRAKGSGKITISTGIVQLSISYIQITVEDDGEGIRNEIKDKIFDKGFTTDERGSGMGLFIARHIIVNIYGGHIDFESTVGKGTRFDVRLPEKRQSVR
jgi:signal transduction histidine kinase